MTPSTTIDNSDTRAFHLPRATRPLKAIAATVVIVATLAAISGVRPGDALAAGSIGICTTEDCPTVTYSAQGIVYGPVWTKAVGNYLVKAYDVYDYGWRWQARFDCYWTLSAQIGWGFNMPFLGCWQE